MVVFARHGPMHHRSSCLTTIYINIAINFIHGISILRSVSLVASSFYNFGLSKDIYYNCNCQTFKWKLIIAKHIDKIGSFTLVAVSYFIGWFAIQTKRNTRTLLQTKLWSKWPATSLISFDVCNGGYLSHNRWNFSMIVNWNFWWIHLERTVQRYEERKSDTLR